MITVPTIGQTGWGEVLNTALEDLDTRLEQVSLNVTDYGTVGAAVDSAPAIQAALDDSPRGGIVYLPPEVIGTLSPVQVPPYVTLMGSHAAGEVQPGAPAPVSGLKPLAGFSGDAVIEGLDQQLGGYSILSAQQRIERLTIDGSASPASVDGIRMTGQIQAPIIRDVAIRDVTGGAINTVFNLDAPPGPQAPFVVRLDRVTIMWPTGTGVALNNSTDSILTDVYVLGGSSFGWFISGAGNSTLIACRGEWCELDGFRITVGNGNLRMIGCSTDRNTSHGLSVDGDAGYTLLMSACTLTRDGRNFGAGGGDKAGLNADGADCHIVADNLIIHTGADDDGVTGPQTPQYGVRALNSEYIALNSGIVGGVDAAIQDEGGNTRLLRGVSLREATGPSTAVVLSPVQVSRTSATAYSVTDADWRIATAGRGLQVAEGANAKMGVATLVAGTVTVANTSVTANSRIFIQRQAAGGTLGNITYTASAGVSFTINSSSATDTSTVDWHIVEPA